MPEVCLGIRQLAEFLLREGDIDSRFTGFDRALEGARIHRRLQKAAGEGYQSEVSLTAARTVEGIEYRLEGRADGIFTDACGVVTIDEIKTTAVPSEHITEEMNPCHWAQGMLYAAIYGREQHLDALAVRLTYYQIDEEKAIYFTRNFTITALDAFLVQLLVQYAPWARRSLEHHSARSASLGGMVFPFSGWRSGQKAMAGEVYHACTEGRRLFCQAPTGTGKTMSALFPALKAMGEGHGDKLFYLTARTTARAAAEDALSHLQGANPGLALRSITLTAKEKACLAPNAEGRPECIPERCPYAKGYYGRSLPALADALDTCPTLSRETLAALGEKYTVCPFELGLDCSEWCDVIIGDYNYLFDPVVKLQRFFERKGDYTFLVDEAHNLPDRSRDMYSAFCTKGMLLDAKRALGKQNSRLKKALSAANNTLLAYRKACSGIDAAPEANDFAPVQATFLPEPGSAPEEDIAQGTISSRAEAAPEASLFGEETPLSAEHGTRFYASLPKSLSTALRHVLPAAEGWLEEHREGETHEAILQMYFSLRDFLRTAEGYDSHYVTRLSARGADFEVELICLDPSVFLDKCLACGQAAVLFSATITPPSYYKNILGCEDARAVALKSPFPTENLGLYCLSGISTRYRDRSESLVPIAEALYAMAGAKVGNYLAFFPSYAYLRQVQEVFTQKYPELPVLVQESGLDEAGRAAFLAQFDTTGSSSLLGFCVMGGVFGEGIDLAGDKLIGCAVVGVGLPQVNPRQEMLRRYFEQQAGCGFDYAYRFPGMNKVLQAAGRVIRTETDEGVVLLIDDRFASAQYRALFPPHWAGMQYIPDTAALSQGMAAFWARHTAQSK